MARNRRTLMCVVSLVMTAWISLIHGGMSCEPPPERGRGGETSACKRSSTRSSVAIDGLRLSASISNTTAAGSDAAAAVGTLSSPATPAAGVPVVVALAGAAGGVADRSSKSIGVAATKLMLWLRLLSAASQRPRPLHAATVEKLSTDSVWLHLSAPLPRYCDDR